MKNLETKLSDEKKIILEAEKIINQENLNNIVNTPTDFSSVKGSTIDKKSLPVKRGKITEKSSFYFYLDLLLFWQFFLLYLD